MKKLFVVALAAIGMVACVQNEVVEIAKSDAIAFADAFISNSTRAEVGEAIDPSFGEKENQEELTAFQVWAFMNENDGTVFNGDVVTKKGENLWGYDVLQYWMPGGNKYYFAGVAPVDGNWTAKNDDTSNLYPVDIIDFINVDGTEDLLFAEAQVETPATIENMEKVKMQFRHLLSKVKFTFKNTFGTENVRVNVTDIQMVVPAAASINMVSNVWGAPAAETLTLNFGGTEKIDALGDKHEAEKELLTIPTVDYDYEVKFTVEVFQGEQLAFTREMTSTLSGLVLEQGKAYNFTADINQDVLDLKPIEFTATVVDWVVSGAPDFDESVAEAELLAALQLTGRATLTGDVELTTPLVITGDATIDLGGYTIKGGKPYEAGLVGADISAIVVEGGNLTIEGEGAVEGATYGVYAKDGATLTIKGGEYSGITSAVQVGVATVNIEGGSFSNSADDKRYTINCLDGDYRNGDAIVNITGGKFFQFDPANNKAEGAGTNFVAPGFESVANGDWFVVGVAKTATDVDGLKDALNTAAEVNIDSAINNGSNVINVQNNDVVINMNNEKITAGGNGTNNYAFNLYNSVVEVNDANLDGAGFAVMDGTELTVNSGKIAAKPGKSGRNMFYVTGNSTVTVNEGTYTFDRISCYFVYVEAGSTCYINGGHYEKPLANSASKDSFVNSASAGKVIITGGTFNVDPTKWLAEGYKAVKSGKIWTVSAE